MAHVLRNIVPRYRRIQARNERSLLLAKECVGLVLDQSAYATNVLHKLGRAHLGQRPVAPDGSKARKQEHLDADQDWLPSRFNPCLAEELRANIQVLRPPIPRDYSSSHLFEIKPRIQNKQGMPAPSRSGANVYGTAVGRRPTYASQAHERLTGGSSTNTQLATELTSARKVRTRKADGEHHHCLKRIALAIAVILQRCRPEGSPTNGAS
ncbi:hypothetical protein FBZ94_11056 [Bradyrhizobium sacchari]|uniref:Uncharacterized protein n=1 Tax=Bradyrhizobium sacchari TaxID=1399419 RepID=A0A560JMC9_9BRAD|nr:hypothetical protein FBZ94_11056 [Bradyrhizobium sacchari]TWB69460.1 hypothetical protein FBZ95_10956 [Bradyrhizobium sacchari]